MNINSGYRISFYGLVISLMIFSRNTGAENALEKFDFYPAVKNCSTWFKERSYGKLSPGVDIPMAFYAPEKSQICIDGNFGGDTSKEVIEQIKKSSTQNNVTLVIRSLGGDINPAIEISEEIQRGNFTIVVHEICASSCANYIFIAGKKRVVLPEGLLLFHGGASLDLLDKIAVQINQYFKDDKEGYEREVEKSRKNLLTQIKRQEDLLKKSNAAQHFFYWMGMINHMTKEDVSNICGTQHPSMILYDTKILDSMRVHIENYFGPTSSEELGLILKKRNIDARMCFWK